jgi:hypothetical protein
MFTSVARSIANVTKRWREKPAAATVRVEKQKAKKEVGAKRYTGTVYAKASITVPGQVPGSILFRGRNKRKGWAAT